LMLRSVCYFVDGDELVVHVWPSTSRYPIRKIASVTRTTGLMASAATSATQRLAIRFTDRSVLKSAMPIYISPVRQDEFIRQLLEINPNIWVEG
ncbi:MAG: PH domain-containing protein, partial [Bacteroidales bacterium]|nr:PH domain-containing protein [Bacteroidales bacterium]